MPTMIEIDGHEYDVDLITQRLMDARRFPHKEAFCVMQYKCEEEPESEVEHVWNSRNGVTPFCIPDRSKTKFMNHINWQSDIYAPNHKPDLGDRIFVDSHTSISTCIAAYKANIKKFQEQGRAQHIDLDDLKMNEEQIAQEMLQPKLVVVTPEIKQMFD